MGSVIADASRSGVYVSKSASKRGLDSEFMDEEDSKKKRGSTRQVGRHSKSYCKIVRIEESISCVMKSVIFTASERACAKRSYSSNRLDHRFA